MREDLTDELYKKLKNHTLYFIDEELGGNFNQYWRIVFRATLLLVLNYAYLIDSKEPMKGEYRHNGDKIHYEFWVERGDSKDKK